MLHPVPGYLGFIINVIYLYVLYPNLPGLSYIPERQSQTSGADEVSGSCARTRATTSPGGPNGGPSRGRRAGTQLVPVVQTVVHPGEASTQSHSEGRSPVVQLVVPSSQASPGGPNGGPFWVSKSSEAASPGGPFSGPPE